MSLRDRVLLGSAGLAAVVALLWFTALAPKRHEAADLATRVTQADQVRKVAAASALSGEAAKATYRRDYATVVRLGKAVPTHADVPSLVLQLEHAARAAKVDFRALSIQTSTAPGTPVTPAAGGLTPAPFTIAFEGSYFGLRRLLDALGRLARVDGSKVSVSGRLLTLDAVKLSAGRDGLPQLKAEIAAKAYVAPTPGAPTSAAPAAAPTATTAPAATPAATPAAAPAAPVTP